MTKSERAALLAAAADVDQDVPAMVRDAINEYVADFSERRIFRAG